MDVNKLFEIYKIVQLYMETSMARIIEYAWYTFPFSYKSPVL